MNWRFIGVRLPRTGAVCVGVAVLAWYGWVADAYVRHSLAERRLAAGVRFAENSDYSAARQEFSAAVALEKDNAYSQAGLGLLLERLATAHAAFGDVHSRPLFRYSNHKLLNGSLRAFEQALKLNPNDDSFLHNLGWLHALDGDWRRGRTFIERALAVRNSAISRVSLGLMLERSGLCERAFEQFAEAVRLSPSLVDSEFYQALVARHPEAARRAVEIAAGKLREALRKSSSPVLAARLGKLCLSQGKLDEAAELLKQVSSDLPNMPKPWLNLAVLDHARSEPWLAEGHLRRALALDSGDARSWYELARHLETDDRPEDAVTCYRRAAALADRPVSDHAQMSTRLYGVQRVIRDDVIPKGLLAYSRDSGTRAAALKRADEIDRELAGKWASQEAADSSLSQEAPSQP